MKFIRILKAKSISKAGIDFSSSENPFILLNEFPIGEIPIGLESSIKAFIKEKSINKSDRMVHLAAFLAEKIMNDIALHEPILINIGSSRGATESWEKFHKDFSETGKLRPTTSPLTTQAHISSTIASMIESDLSFSIDHSLTCSTGTSALVNAIAWLKSGMSKYALVGGSEASNTGFTLAQIKALGIGSKYTNEFPCRPFNIEEQNSFVLGEGAGLALLDYCDESQIQSGDIIIEGIGFAQTAPPSLTGIDPSGKPLQKAMKMAINNCIEIPDLILAHAPGTVKGDRAEFNAIQTVFPDKTPAIFSSKWITGHTYGASGMLNISLAEKIFNDYYPPQYPFKTYSAYIHPKKTDLILINSTGFGGNAVSILLRKI